VTTVRNVAGDVPGIREPGFIGREREIEALGQALARPGAVVLIEGEAGIGKTRLVREFLASPVAQARKALVTVCPPLRQPHTLGPVTDALRQAIPSVAALGLSGLAGALRALFPEWSGDLPPSPEPAEDASAARYRVFAALAELLDRVGLGVLVAEDVQWADEATLEFLVFLASRRPRRMSLVLTYRGEEISGGSLLLRLSRLASSANGLRLALGPLDSAETSAMVSSMLEGEPVSAEFAAFVRERTDGLPLAVEESVRVMADHADLIHENGAWVRRDLAEITVPPTIRDAVLDRFQRLSGSAQAALRAAAVLGDPAPEPLLAAVAGHPAESVSGGLDEAVGCGLLSENDHGLVSFRHALACRAVYEAIPVSQRRTLHLRTGEALEGTSPAPVAQLARHFREAGDNGRWCEYAEATADIAQVTGDEASAFDVLHELITSGTLPAGSAARLTRKMPLMSFIPLHRYHELARALRDLLGTQGVELEAGEEGEVRAQLGRILGAADEVDAACAELERAIPNLAHNPAEAARAMALLGYPHGAAHPKAVHLRWLKRAAEAEAGTSMAPADQLRLAVDRITHLLMLGQEEGWAEASRIPAHGPTPRERQEIARVTWSTGDMAMVWGRYPDATRLLANALEMTERHQYRRFRDNVVAAQAHLDWFTGTWTRLRERVRPLADDHEIQPTAFLLAELITGLLDAVAGARARAEERLTFVLDEWTERGEVVFLAEPAAALARLRLSDGRVEEALTVTDEPTGIVARKEIWVWATDLVPARVSALVAAGRAREAAELVTAFECGLRGTNAPAPQNALMLCQAVLAQARGDGAEAAIRYGQTAEAWQALPRPYDALLAQEQQAACLLTCGQLEAGLSLLRRVFEGLADLGARADALRVMERLGQHGVRVGRPWWGGSRGYGGNLSPREQEVVRLLAGGRTNRDIGKELFISPKTVACHVDSARRKLGLASRTALVIWAAETAAAGPDALIRQ
jgi:DNA-binding CsgD family transcriptional regulator